MNTNTDALRSLVLKIIDCFITNGTVTSLRGQVVQIATADVQKQFTDLRAEACVAETQDSLGDIAAKIRILSVRHNFYIPRQHMELYEALTAIKYLHERGILALIPWPRVRY